MKAMTCRELGGACDSEFRAASFEEIAEISKQHGMAMLQKQDPAHLKAMQSMKELMQKPEAMQAWFAEKQQQFDALPDIDDT